LLVIFQSKATTFQFTLIVINNTYQKPIKLNRKKGGAGVVKKAIWMKAHEVAVKMLNNSPEFTDDQEQASFLKEIQILSELRHVRSI
jgi:serine/threonine protein kinase